MASIRGILNIQSLNELTSRENKLIVTPAEDAVDPRPPAAAPRPDGDERVETAATGRAVADVPPRRTAPDITAVYIR